MPVIDARKTIVVCLDIDETLMNSPSGGFNGTVGLWKKTLRQLIQHGAEFGVHVIVQIITAKRRVDPAVDKVAAELREFLPMYSPSGKLLDVNQSCQSLTSSGYFMLFHQYKSVSMRQRDFNKGKQQVIKSIVKESLLPAIHFCVNNNTVGHAPSKALVMRYISQFFKTEIPSENLFLLDNSRAIEVDIQTGAHGQTPIYHFVSAHDLERFSDYSQECRDSLCQHILLQLEKGVKQRVKAITHLCTHQEEREALDYIDQLFSGNLKPSNELHLDDPQIDESPADELTHLEHSSNVMFDGHSLRTVIHEQRQLKQFLKHIYFDEHLSFFKEKARRKAGKAQVHPNNSTAHEVAQKTQQLSDKLISAKNEFLRAKVPIEEAKKTFIQECTGAIHDADSILLRQHSFANRFGKSMFFSNKKSYYAIRNAFVGSLDRSNQL